jgi:hypothetical protein
MGPLPGGGLPGLNRVKTTPAEDENRPSLWDRISAGLLGLPSRELLGGDLREDARRQGLMSMGASILGDTGATPEYLSFNQILGRGIQAGHAGAMRGAETGMTLQDRQMAQGMLALRQGVYAKYQDQMDNPAALREAANELLQGGDAEGAKILADIAKGLTGEEGLPPIVTGVPLGAEPGTRPSIMERVGPGPGGLRKIATAESPPSGGEPRMFEEGVIRLYEADKDVYEPAYHVMNRSLKDVNEAMEPINSGPAQIAVLRGFLSAIQERPGMTSREAGVVQSGATFRDTAKEWLARLSEGEASVIPTSFVKLMAEIIRERRDAVREQWEDDYRSALGRAKRWEDVYPRAADAINPPPWIGKTPAQRAREQDIDAYIEGLRRDRTQ